MASQASSLMTVNCLHCCRAPEERSEKDSQPQRPQNYRLRSHLTLSLEAPAIVGL